MVTGMLDVPVCKNLNDMAAAYMDAAGLYPVAHGMSKTGMHLTGMHLQGSTKSDE
jgi:hypothetical protein